MVIVTLTPAQLIQCTLGEGVASSIYTLFETALNNSNSIKTSSPVVEMDQ